MKPAGTLQYIPRLVLDETKRTQIRQLLIQSGLVQEPENPEIVVDWYEAEKDAENRIVRQVHTVVYRDGGDAEAPAVLFYRLEKNRQTGETREYYHIPPADRQAELADAWRWWEDAAKLNRLTDYAQSIPEDNWIQFA